MVLIRGETDLARDENLAFRLPSAPLAAGAGGSSWPVVLSEAFFSAFGWRACGPVHITVNHDRMRRTRGRRTLVLHTLQHGFEIRCLIGFDIKLDNRHMVIERRCLEFEAYLEMYLNVSADGTRRTYQ